MLPVLPKREVEQPSFAPLRETYFHAKPPKEDAKAQRIRLGHYQFALRRIEIISRGIISTRLIAETLMLEQFKSYFDRMAERLSSSRTVRRGPVFTIFHNPNALKLSWVGSKDRGEVVVAWQDTVSVEAFKRDLYAVDLICITFHLRNKKVVEIDEEMDGWESLMTSLPEYLPGCQTFGEWYTDVAVPAFKTNLTVIYRRD